MTAVVFPTYFLARTIVRHARGAVRGRGCRGRARARLLADDPRGAARLSVRGAPLLPDRQGARSRAHAGGSPAPWSPRSSRRLVRGELGVIPVVLVSRPCCTSSRARPAAAGGRAGRAGTGSARSCSTTGAIIFFSASAGNFSQSWSIATGHYRGRMLDYGVWAGRRASTIGLGVAAGRRRARRARPAEGRGADAARCARSRRSSAPPLIGFGIYTAVKASYLSTVFGT